MKVICALGRKLLPQMVAVSCLTGCASYTINTTNDFTRAADQLNQVVASADSSRVSADNAYKEMLVSNGSECNVAPAFTFIRSLSDNHTMVYQRSSATQILTAAGGGSISRQCKMLLECEERPTIPGCSSTCYSDDESSCIDQLIKLSGDKTQKWDPTELRGLSTMLGEITYPESSVIRTQAEQDTLSLFSQYLDQLKKAATPQPTWANKVLDSSGNDLNASISSELSGLSKKVENARDKYNKVAAKLKTPVVGGVSSAKLDKETSALGTLFDVRNEIAQQNGEAKMISTVVKKYQKQIHDDIVAIGEDIASDMLMAVTKQGIANGRMRSKYEKQFRNTADSIAREGILVTLKTYPALTPYQLKQVTEHKELTAAIGQVV